MKIELQSFIVPNYVIVKMPIRSRQEGLEPPKFHLKDIDVETLDELCNCFRREVFLKAEKKDPWK